jgi:hydroxymethylglutaryl-CoA reductase (NADPH)
LFSPFSHDSSLAFTLPFDQVPQFLKAVQEIPDTSSDEDDGEQKKWIMRAARGPAYGSGSAVKLWFADAWGSFVDLIKVNDLPYLVFLPFLLTYQARRNY